MDADYLTGPHIFSIDQTKLPQCVFGAIIVRLRAWRNRRRIFTFLCPSATVVRWRRSQWARIALSRHSNDKRRAIRLVVVLVQLKQFQFRWHLKSVKMPCSDLKIFLFERLCTEFSWLIDCFTGIVLNPFTRVETPETIGKLKKQSLFSTWKNKWIFFVNLLTQTNSRWLVVL